jgi:hypothetical protein
VVCAALSKNAACEHGGAFSYADFLSFNVVSMWTTLNKPSTPGKSEIVLTTLNVGGVLKKHQHKPQPPREDQNKSRTEGNSHELEQNERIETQGSGPICVSKRASVYIDNA